MTSVRILFRSSLIACAFAFVACGPGESPDAGDVVHPRDNNVVDNVTPDVVPDVPVTDMGVDVVMDTGMDATMDAAPDAAPDASPEAGSPQTFVATLTGAQENPPVHSAAMGMATVTLSADRTMITYMVTHNVSGATAGHIHMGAPGTNGSVVIPFASATSPIMGTAAVTPALATALETAQLYANIHSSTSAGGEIRGQLLRPGEKLYLAHMTGAQENPPVTTTNTGSAYFILRASGTRIFSHVQWTGTATAGHIHRGFGGTNGPVAIDLSITGMGRDNEDDITAGDAMLLDHAGMYVNVHTTLNAGGECRGQILKPGEILFTAALLGVNEVPPVVTTATGSLGVVLNFPQTEITYSGSVTGLTPTAAHLHMGTVGMNGSVVVPLMFTGTTLGLNTAGVTSTIVTAMIGNGIYANVHTLANPGGEIRGQLVPQ
jgi:hypothetical protein